MIRRCSKRGNRLKGETWAVSVGFGIVRKLSLTFKKKITVMKMQDFSVSVPVDLSVFIGDLEGEGLDTDDYGM